MKLLGGSIIPQYTVIQTEKSFFILDRENPRREIGDEEIALVLSFLFKGEELREVLDKQFEVFKHEAG